MSDHVATLGLAVDSSAVRKATGDLRAFRNVAEQASKTAALIHEQINRPDGRLLLEEGPFGDRCFVDCPAVGYIQAGLLRMR